MANVDLLRRTMAEIRRNPDQWNQYQWRDCFAGIAIRIYNETHDIELIESIVDSQWSVAVPHEEGPGHEWVPIPERARDLLDLNRTEAEELFYFMNTVEDLEEVIERIENGEIEEEEDS